MHKEYEQGVNLRTRSIYSLPRPTYTQGVIMYLVHWETYAQEYILYVAYLCEVTENSDDELDCTFLTHLTNHTLK